MIRYARWDGGRIHVVKGILSSWPYITEPDEVEAAMGWYDDSTIPLIEQAAINWIWVTWSVGFPPEDEALQQREVARYIARCHERGVRVTAYVSLTNAFPAAWRRRGEAIDGWLQRDAQGRAIPYGAVAYAGDPTRHLVCLREPGWLAYLRRQVVSALDAGVDGILYDNVGAGCQCERCDSAFRVYAKEAAGRDFDRLPDFGHAAMGIVEKVQRVVGVEPSGPRPDEQAAWLWRRFVDRTLAEAIEGLAAVAHAMRPGVHVYANHNVDMGTLCYPAADVVSTEDGREPGLAADATHIQNGGLLRVVVASSDGRRPMRMEYAVGHGGGQDEVDDEVGNSRFVPMSARSQQRSIAEAAMYGVTAEINPEGCLKGGLRRGDAWALATWAAIERYHDFLAGHSELYLDNVSTATTSVVVPDRWPDDDPLRIGMLDALLAAGLDFDVVLDRQLSAAALATYDLILVADVPVVPDEAAAALAAAVERGSTVLATPGCGRLARTLAPATASLSDRIPGIRVTGPSTDFDALSRSMTELATTPYRIVGEAPLVHAVRRSARGIVVHLLNLGDAPLGPISLSGFGSGPARAFSPDPTGPLLQYEGENLRVSGLDLYAVVEFATPGSAT